MNTNTTEMQHKKHRNWNLTLRTRDDFVDIVMSTGIDVYRRTDVCVYMRYLSWRF